MRVLGILAAFLLVACVAAHVILVIAIVPSKRWRAAVAFVVPPLAVWWAWARGERWRVWLWVGVVAAYGAVVTIAGGGEP